MCLPLAGKNRWKGTRSLRTNRWKPSCQFVATWLQDHPTTAQIAAREEGDRGQEGDRVALAPGGREIAPRKEVARSKSDVDRPNAWMQSSEEVGIYAKPQPLFAKFTKLQTSIAKPLEEYFLVFFINLSMQSLFGKPWRCSDNATRASVMQSNNLQLSRQRLPASKGT